MNSEAYELAQTAVAELKAAIHQILNEAGDRGLTVEEIAGALGITGMPEALLKLMQTEEVVETKDGFWILKIY